MIEIQAKLLRGPVYFVDETIQCLITLRNVTPPQTQQTPQTAVNNNSSTTTSDSLSSSSHNGHSSSSSSTVNGNHHHSNSSKSSSNDKNNGDSCLSLPTERLCWANVQLHCFCLMDESQIGSNDENQSNKRQQQSITSNGMMKSTKRSSIALETYTSNDTSFHECLLRAEKGQILYSSKPKILFCDLQLAPFECQTFVFTETLPSTLNPSYSSPRLKYFYKLVIGAQRIGAPIHLLKIPIRILTIDDGFASKEMSSSIDGCTNHQNTVVNDVQEEESTINNNNNNNNIDEIKELSLNNDNSPGKNSFTTDDDSQDISTPLDLAIHRIEYLVGHRTPHNFNITSTFGRVAKFFIFKTAYRMGEDIIGFFNFSEGTVPCVRFTGILQSEEIVADSYRVGNKSAISHTTNHAKYQECTLNTQHSQMVLTIPYTVTPTFNNETVSLNWKLHFRFVISQNSEQALPVIYSQTEDGVQQVAPRQLNVQTMTWDFPIKIVATYPAHVAKGFQMTSIGTLNI